MKAFLITIIILMLLCIGQFLNSADRGRVDQFLCFIIHICLAAWAFYLLVSL